LVFEKDDSISGKSKQSADEVQKSQNHPKPIRVVENEVAPSDLKGSLLVDRPIAGFVQDGTVERLKAWEPPVGESTQFRYHPKSGILTKVGIGKTEDPQRIEEFKTEFAHRRDRFLHLRRLRMDKSPRSSVMAR
jgi:hypothetical protein